MLNIGTVVSLIKTLAPAADPATIESAVTDWLDEHPEATTTVTDGSITEAKLATALAAKIALITQQSEEIAEHGSTISGVVEKLESKSTGHNLCNPSGVSVGFVSKAGVVNSGATGYRYTPKIAVSQGQIIRCYGVTDGAFALMNLTCVTAYNSSDVAVEASGGGARNDYTVPSGITSIIISVTAKDSYMVTADYVATAFEAYQAPYYVATDDFISEAVTDMMDSTLADNSKIAPAGAVGTALGAKVSTSQGAANAGKILKVNSSGNLELTNPETGGSSESVKYGNWETVVRDETAAVIAIDNSVLTAPIANAIKSNIISISGTADGTYPTGFIAYSKNLLCPELVCACPGNQAAGYQVNMSNPSTAHLTNNGDGTFNITYALGWSNGLMLSAPLTEGETYEIYADFSVVSGGFSATIYTLGSDYKVVQKLVYISSSIRKLYRLKLNTGEKYFAITFASGSNSEVRTTGIAYPEIRVSETKNDDYTLVQSNTVSNVYWYQPYKKSVLSFDTASIFTAFPGFGQANGENVNVLYPAQKTAFQYGYYSDGVWTDDVKTIDLSEVLTDTAIDISPNGTLELLYTGSTVPAWTAEYILSISEPYTGCVWSGLGDSITAGLDSSASWGFYRQDVKKALGLYKYNDCGVGTSALSGVGSYRAMWTDERVETLPLDSDVVTIMGGTNDTPQLAAVTSPNDKFTGWGDASLDNLDCTTFIGAYNVLISKIMYKFQLSAGYYQDIDYTGLTQVETVKPWFRLVLIAPPPVFTSADTIEAMTKICECVQKVGALWGLPVVNAHDNIGVNDANKAEFFSVDYIHPNAEAHRRIANLIIAKAREIN